ncbi:hypothetical protein [Salipiger sp.]|uniref:hypothetical protein n=1 Tax=Salipiger sp. TaxID=2078585 RepID=UPI003A971047
MTKIFLATPEQAHRALAVARAINSELTVHTVDGDGTELSVNGDDYLTPTGSHDVAGAICDLPDPEGLVGVLELASEAGELTEVEVLALTGRSKADWVESIANEG